MRPTCFNCALISYQPLKKDSFVKKSFLYGLYVLQNRKNGHTLVKGLVTFSCMPLFMLHVATCLFCKPGDG